MGYDSSYVVAIVDLCACCVLIYAILVFIFFSPRLLFFLLLILHSSMAFGRKDDRWRQGSFQLS